MTRSQWRWFAFLPAAAIPALFPLYLILHFGVNIPYQDQWAAGLGDILVKFHDGNLTFHDLVKQQNEHRMLIPRLLIIVLGTLTHWNTIVEMLFGWLMVCFSSAGMLWLIRRLTVAKTDAPAIAAASANAPIAMEVQLAGGEVLPPPPLAAEPSAAGHWSSGPDERTIFIWFLCNVLLFTPTGWEIWLWGISPQFFLPPALFIWTFIVTQSRLNRWIRISLGILACSAATFTHGNGFLSWPILALIWAWAPSWADFKPRIGILIAWTIACLLNISMYAYGYEKPKPAARLAVQISLLPEGTPPGGLVHKVGYTMAFLGAPLAGSDPINADALAMVTGGLMLAMLLATGTYFVWRGGGRVIPVWAIVGAGLGAATGILIWHATSWPMFLCILLVCVCGPMGGAAGGALSWLARRVIRNEEYELCQRMLVWLVLAVFALLSAIMAAIFRDDQPLSQARSSRYCAFAVLMPIALINLVAIVTERLRTDRARDAGRARGPIASNFLSPSSPLWVQLPAVLASAVIVMNLLGLHTVDQVVRKERQIRAQFKSGVLFARLMPTNMILEASAGPDRLRLLNNIEAINAMGYLHPPLITSRDPAVLEDTEFPAKDAGKIGMVEAFGWQANAPGRMMATGWAIGRTLPEPAHLIFLTYENEKQEEYIVSMCDQTTDRDDLVAAKFGGNKNYVNCGWAVTFAVADLPQYMKAIRIHVWALDVETGKAVRLPEAVPCTAYQSPG